MVSGEQPRRASCAARRTVRDIPLRLSAWGLAVWPALAAQEPEPEPPEEPVPAEFPEAYARIRQDDQV